MSAHHMMGVHHMSCPTNGKRLRMDVHHMMRVHHMMGIRHTFRVPKASRHLQLKHKP